MFAYKSIQINPQSLPNFVIGNLPYIEKIFYVKIQIPENAFLDTKNKAYTEINIHIYCDQHHYINTYYPHCNRWKGESYTTGTNKQPNPYNWNEVLNYFKSKDRAAAYCIHYALNANKLEIINTNEFTTNDYGYIPH